MKFPFYIARRYAVAKKSHHSINIITGISVAGVAIATAAMVCILSVFNGFEDMVARLFTAFDPQIKVLPATGKYVSQDDPLVEKVKKMEGVEVATFVVEDKALISADYGQAMVTIKGVDDSFTKLTEINKILVGDGDFKLHAVDLQYGVCGLNILSKLGMAIDFSTPLQVYAPKKGERINLNNPMDDFRHDELYSPRVAFQVMQAKYDSNYIITSLEFAQRLFDKEGKITALEIEVGQDDDVDRVKKKVKQMAAGRFRVIDRYEQQEDTFKIMEVEKLISYIFLTFILIIASFNIIGSLSMLIIDKKEDVKTLKNLGATKTDISRIFMIEGWIVSAVGAIAGVVIGVGICIIQQQFGVIKFGSSPGNYIVDAYPVLVKPLDILIVVATVILIGMASVYIPVRNLKKNLSYNYNSNFNKNEN